jgi:O-antigen/teichoic acid export membrane protein
MKKLFLSYFSTRIQTLRTISIFTLSNIANAAIVFVSLGLYLKYLPPEEYGKAIFFALLVSLIGPVVNINTNAFFWATYFDYEDRVRNEIYSTLYFFTFSICLFLTSLFVILPINNIFPVDLGLFVLAVPAASFFSFLNEDIKSLYIYQKRIYNYVVINNGLTLIENILIVLLIRYSSPTFHSRIQAWLVVLFFSFLIHLYVFGKKNNYLSFVFVKRRLSAALRFGYPLMFQQWSKMALNASDRWFLAGIVNFSQMGIYNLGYQIGSSISTVISGYLNFLTPVLYKNLSEKNTANLERVKKQFFIFLGLLSFAIIGLYLCFLVIAKPLWGDKYFYAAPFILYIGVSTILYAISMPYSSALSYMQRTNYLAVVSVVTLVLNLVLNYFLITRYLTFGAAYSTVISYLIFSLLVYYFYRLEFKKSKKVELIQV